MVGLFVQDDPEFSLLYWSYWILKGYSSDQDDELESFLNDSDEEEEDDDDTVEIDSSTGSEGEAMLTNGVEVDEDKQTSSDCEEIEYVPRKSRLRNSRDATDVKHKER